MVEGGEWKIGTRNVITPKTTLRDRLILRAHRKRNTQAITGNNIAECQKHPMLCLLVECYEVSGIEDLALSMSAEW